MQAWVFSDEKPKSPAKGGSAHSQNAEAGGS
jgi:hypothetical protein